MGVGAEPTTRQYVERSPLAPSPWSSGEYGPLSQLSRTHMGSQRLKQQAQGMCGSAQVLCVCCGCWLCVTVGLLTVGAGVSLILSLLFSCYWVALASLNVRGFALYLVLS